MMLVTFSVAAIGSCKQTRKERQSVHSNLGDIHKGYHDQLDIMLHVSFSKSFRDMLEKRLHFVFHSATPLRLLSLFFITKNQFLLCKIQTLFRDLLVVVLVNKKNKIFKTCWHICWNHILGMPLSRNL